MTGQSPPNVRPLPGDGCASVGADSGSVRRVQRTPRGELTRRDDRRRAWAVSALLHAFALVVLWNALPEQKPAARAHVAVTATAPAPAPAIEEREASDADAALAAEIGPPPEAEPPAHDDSLPVPFADTAGGRAVLAVRDLRADQRSGPPLDVPATRFAPGRTRPVVPPTPPATPTAPPAAAVAPVPQAATPQGLGPQFGKSGADEAMYTVARALAGDGGAGRLLGDVRGRAGGRSIVVLRGEFDRCESVLGKLELPHVLADPADLAAGPIGRDVKAIVVGCCPHPLPPQAVQNIERWVARGGRLFTTDWGLETVLDRAFGRYVRCARDRNRVIMLPELVVDVQPAAAHRLTEGVPPRKQIARWWLEESTIPVHVVDRQAVSVLLTAPELGRRHNAPAAAVTFAHGEGRVLHMLGHVYQQQGNLRGAYALHRILLNFFDDALGRGSAAGTSTATRRRAVPRPAGR